MKNKGIPSSRLEAEVLLSHVLKISRIQLYAKFDMPLGEEDKDRYRELVKKRADSIPTAYLLGTKNFFGYDFFVDERVLIPRPETEELVDYALKSITSKEQDAVKVLDLCSGSGCIGITFALENKSPYTTVHFVDVSQDALDVTRANADSLFTQKNLLAQLEESKFILSDLFESINSDEKYDLIISNPPYILKEEESSLSQEVSKEPRLALVVGDFEEFHTRLLSQAKNHIASGGSLWLETNPLKMDSLVMIAENLGWKTEVISDLTKRKRFLKAY